MSQSTPVSERNSSEEVPPHPGAIIHLTNRSLFLMKELNRLISTLSSSDIHPFEISSARMVSVDDSLNDLEDRPVPAGKYLSVEMKFLMPAGK